jgi:phenol hydroxylase P5 protein
VFHLRVQVLDGDFDHGEATTFALMDYEREEGKCLACCATLNSDVVIEAEIEEDPDARVIPVQDFAGRVSRIENLTPTIKGIFIDLDHEIDFQAGQYVNLHLPGTKPVACLFAGQRAVEQTRSSSTSARCPAAPRRPGSMSR